MGSCLVRVQLEAGAGYEVGSWTMVSAEAGRLSYECKNTVPYFLFFGGWTTAGVHERIKISLEYTGYDGLNNKAGVGELGTN